MKTKNLITLCFITVLFAFSSCKKNSDGGKAEIHALIYHGSTEIRNSTLYVKYGATSAPSDPTMDYDLKLSGASDDNHVHVEEMRRGDYYLYAVGMDTLINQKVKGGTHVKIKWSERKKLVEYQVQVQ